MKALRFTRGPLDFMSYGPYWPFASGPYLHLRGSFQCTRPHLLVVDVLSVGDLMYNTYIISVRGALLIRTLGDGFITMIEV